MGSISCFPGCREGEKDEGVLGLCKQPVNMYAQAITPGGPSHSPEWRVRFARMLLGAPEGHLAGELAIPGAKDLTAGTFLWVSEGCECVRIP